MMSLYLRPSQYMFVIVVILQSPLYFVSDQLRQRLVRMSVRHHEQLLAHQQKEQQLMQALKDCAGMLEEAVTLLARNSPDIPSHLVQASMRFTSKALMNGMEDV